VTKLTVLFIAFATASCGLAERVSNTTVNSNSVNSAQPSNSETTSGSSEAEGTAVNTVPIGPCANDHYPVDPSLVRNYKITGDGPAEYSLKQISISDSEFKEERTFESGLVVTNNWVCNADGMRTAEFTNTGVMKTGNFQMETVKSTGVTIPKNIEKGKKFNSEYDVTVKLNVAKVMANADGKVFISNTVVSTNDQVEVGGKEYVAARIDSTIKIALTMNGRTVPGATLTMSNWYAPQVGLVKQETGGTYGKQFVELVSVDEK
jgi:hypothetical protein